MSKNKRLLLFLVGCLICTILFFNSRQSPPPAAQSATVLSVDGFATGVYAGEETAYRIELLNHTDQILFDGMVSLTLPVSFTYVASSTLALGADGPMQSREPTITGQTLTWGPYNLPAAINRTHHPYGIHTMMHGCLNPTLHLEAAKTLVGNGGYVTQLFYGLDATTTGPDQCAINFVTEAYARGLIPIIRLEGHFVDGIWQAPDPGPDGDYSEVAAGFARYVAGLPRRDANPLYIQVWNEPDLWIEWSNAPNAGQYARFFVAVSNAIRQLGDGRIRIINAGLTPGNPTFIDQMLRVPGFKDSFDAWSSHCYPYNHPAWYNTHNGTARYGTYAIDCYLEELAVLKKYGRTDVKVMITEAGYELGSNVFGFEGFASINETNRAEYIGQAFNDYWRNWPEVIAVTPFQLSDTSGHWWKFDWIYPTPPFDPHPQYSTVSAQNKPDENLTPIGYSIIFKARADADVAPGIYPSQLSGSERNGATATAEAAPVAIYAPGTKHTYYFPLIFAPPRYDGPWYLNQPDESPPSPGAIVPDSLLTAALLVGQAGLTQTATIQLSDEAVDFDVTQDGRLAAVLLADGRLDIIDLTTRQVKQTVFVADTPQTILVDAPAAGQATIAATNQLVQGDLQTGQITARRAAPGRWRGLALDPTSHTLYAANAAADEITLWTDNLSATGQSLPLDCQPNQLLLNETTAQLYAACPADSRVLAITLNPLAVTIQKNLTGGPILDIALLPTRNKLTVLNALAPGYRGLHTLTLPIFEPVTLLAGRQDFPWRTATAIAATPSGLLLTPENTGLWQISDEDATVHNLTPGLDLSRVSHIAVQPITNAPLLLEPSARQLRIFQ